MARCQSAGYLSASIRQENFKLTIKYLSRLILEKVGVEFDMIAVRGVSGLLIAPVISYRLNKPLAVVRKGEGTHSMHSIEGYCLKVKRYIIIDDLSCSGTTLRYICAQVRKHSPDARCIGAFFYTHNPIGTFHNEQTKEHIPTSHVYVDNGKLQYYDYDEVFKRNLAAYFQSRKATLQQKQEEFRKEGEPAVATPPAPELLQFPRSLPAG